MNLLPERLGIRGIQSAGRKAVACGRCQPVDLIGAIESVVQPACPGNAGTVVVRTDCMNDGLAETEIAQDLRPDQAMAREIAGGGANVDIMQQAGDAPLIPVVSFDHCKLAHDGLDGKRVVKVLCSFNLERNASQARVRVCPDGI